MDSCILVWSEAADHQYGHGDTALQAFNLGELQSHLDGMFYQSQLLGDVVQDGHAPRLLALVRTEISTPLCPAPGTCS